jgi:hypothetical protein
MSKVLKILKKLLKDKNFNFAIDTDKDGKPIVSGQVSLSEAIDELEKVIKKR